MRRIALAAAIISVITGVALVAPGAGQDRSEERLSALETRVAVLETTVAGPEVVLPAGEVHQLLGSLILDGDVVEFRNTEMFCGHGWQDLVITISDADGAVIASGLLDIGEPLGNDCNIGFEIEEIPSVDQYVLSIREDFWAFSYKDLEARNWIVELVIDS
ncbi:MAG: hypothetical protein AB7V46_15855 [Thermomicrobiales bacterium]